MTQGADDLDRDAVRALAVEVVLVAVLLAGVFAAIALAAYGGLTEDGLPVPGGWTGPAGTWLAFGLYQIAGHASLLVAAALVIGAAASLAGRTNAFRPLRLLGAVAAVVCAASIMHIGWAGEKVRGGHDAGGGAGMLVGGRMEEVFAGPGALLILTATLAVVLVLVSGIGPRAFTSVAASIAWQGARRAASLAVRLARSAASAARWLGSRGAKRAEPPCAEDVARDLVIHRDGHEGDPGEDGAVAGGCEPAHRSRRRPKKEPERRAGDFELPPLGFLDEPRKQEGKVSDEELAAMADRLRETLSRFGVEGKVTDIHTGPVVTTVEMRPEPGTKVSAISRLGDDIAMNLEVMKVRIVAPIPGKNAVGFELPTPRRSMVYLSEVMGDPRFSRESLRIPLAVGKDITGKPFVLDLAPLPHLLIAGTTGSGKSVAINTILMSLLFKFAPEDLRLILVDPKAVELQPYAGIPHLLLPVVTDMKHAASALRWAVDEMDRRYHLISSLGFRDIDSYNRGIAAMPPAAPADGGGGPDAADAAPAEEKPVKLPYIVIVIDEFADLMYVSAREVEWAVSRLAAKARAAGIHLLVATQRPSVNVVTGVIKANFPCRVAFKVAAKVDSRVTLDAYGAESLLGEGDMLILSPRFSDLVRVHGAFVSDTEIRKVVDFLRDQANPDYREEILEAGEEQDGLDGFEADDDPIYEEAVRIVLGERRASGSYLQRRLKVGYNKAARMIERMEAEGIVGPAIPGKGQREILAPAAPPPH